MDDLIKQGADALRSGDRDAARKFFSIAVKQNPNSERVWGWLYNVSGNNHERAYCLEQILRINPKNEKANELYKHLERIEVPIPPSTSIAPNTIQKPARLLKKCPYCAEEILVDAVVCRYCGHDLSIKPIYQKDSLPYTVKVSERKVILEKCIAYYVKIGYRVNSQNDTSVQMVKSKKFSGCLASILILTFVLPFILYFIYYLSQKDKTIYVQVGEKGNITITSGDGAVKNYKSVELFLHQSPQILQKQNAIMRLSVLRKELKSVQEDLEKLKKDDGFFTAIKMATTKNKINSLERVIAQYESIANSGNL